jgi:hypothetical protein
MLVNGIRASVQISSMRKYVYCSLSRGEDLDRRMIVSEDSDVLHTLFALFGSERRE